MPEESVDTRWKTFWAELLNNDHWRTATAYPYSYTVFSAAEAGTYKDEKGKESKLWRYTVLLMKTECATPKEAHEKTENGQAILRELGFKNKPTNDEQDIVEMEWTYPVPERVKENLPGAKSAVEGTYPFNVPSLEWLNWVDWAKYGVPTQRAKRNSASMLGIGALQIGDHEEEPEAKKIKLEGDVEG